jgi:hypothetical protein
MRDCDACMDAKEVLYRCRSQDLTAWVFLCGKCLTGAKSNYKDTYQYGEKWNRKKKLGPANVVICK